MAKAVYPNDHILRSYETTPQTSFIRQSSPSARSHDSLNISFPSRRHREARARSLSPNHPSASPKGISRNYELNVAQRLARDTSPKGIDHNYELNVAQRLARDAKAYAEKTRQLVENCKRQRYRFEDEQQSLYKELIPEIRQTMRLKLSAYCVEDVDARKLLHHLDSMSDLTFAVKVKDTATHLHSTDVDLLSEILLEDLVDSRLALVTPAGSSLMSHLAAEMSERPMLETISQQLNRLELEEEEIRRRIQIHYSMNPKHVTLGTSTKCVENTKRTTHEAFQPHLFFEGQPGLPVELPAGNIDGKSHQHLIEKSHDNIPQLSTKLNLGISSETKGHIEDCRMKFADHLAQHMQMRVGSFQPHEFVDLMCEKLFEDLFGDTLKEAISAWDSYVDDVYSKEFEPSRNH